MSCRAASPPANSMSSEEEETQPPTQVQATEPVQGETTPTQVPGASGFTTPRHGVTHGLQRVAENAAYRDHMRKSLPQPNEGNTCVPPCIHVFLPYAFGPNALGSNLLAHIAILRNILVCYALDLFAVFPVI